MQTLKRTESLEVVESAQPEALASLPPAQGLIPTLGRALRAAWQPVPIQAPEVDPDLTALSPIERSAEVLRYKFLQLEYALSPSGALRGWLKLNLLLCLLLAIPAVFIVPILTAVLSAFETWTALLHAAARNLFYALLYLLGIIILLTFVGPALSAFAHNARKGSRRR